MGIQRSTRTITILRSRLMGVSRRLRHEAAHLPVRGNEGIHLLSEIGVARTRPVQVLCSRGGIARQSEMEHFLDAPPTGRGAEGSFHLWGPRRSPSNEERGCRSHTIGPARMSQRRLDIALGCGDSTPLAM